MTKKEDFEAEVKKGLAIKGQLQTYERLLECRIQLQKVLVKVNKLPQTSKWDEFKSEADENHDKELKKCKNAVGKVLCELIEAQFRMRDAECEPPTAKKMKYSQVLADFHANMADFRDETVAKWNEKTKLASGNVTQKSFSSFDTSTLKQIEQILCDKSRLLSRTRTKRTAYKILGKKETDLDLDLEDPEIFDDDDFYHQMLRELIDRKTGDVTDPTQLGKHWLRLQKLRAKAKKANVDTRASKGRKTRYDIHAKLVNFMAPKTTGDGIWSDRAKNELYSSLFGAAAK